MSTEFGCNTRSDCVLMTSVTLVEGSEDIVTSRENRSESFAIVAVEFIVTLIVSHDVTSEHCRFLTRSKASMIENERFSVIL